MLPVFVTPQRLMVTVIAPILVREPIPAEMFHMATFEKLLTGALTEIGALTRVDAVSLFGYGG